MEKAKESAVTLQTEEWIITIPTSIVITILLGTMFLLMLLILVKYTNVLE